MANAVDLRRAEFDARQVARELRRAVFEDGDVEKIAELAAAEKALEQAAAARAAAEGLGGKIVAKKQDDNLLGPDTTGIEAQVNLRMSSVPAALVHLFDAESHPLVEFRIVNHSAQPKRLRLISYVEGFSARAVETIEAAELKPYPVKQLPTFFPDRLATVTELTRASVNVEVQDLDAKTEVHRTVPVWLLARSTAPLQVKDPSTGQWVDMTKYLGAFVTPNAPAVMKQLRAAADKHPNKRIVGYQGDEAEIESQVKAVYESLAANGTRYVNSTIDFTPESDTANQRVRLPRESLDNTSANCIDGTLLMASLLEAASLNPAIVIVPGHAFLAWETWRNNGKWRYVETTMISTDSFADACIRGDTTAAKWEAADKAKIKVLSLRDLRAAGITPLE